MPRFPFLTAGLSTNAKEKIKKNSFLLFVTSFLSRMNRAGHVKFIVIQDRPRALELSQKTERLRTERSSGDCGRSQGGFGAVVPSLEDAKGERKESEESIVV